MMPNLRWCRFVRKITQDQLAYKTKIPQPTLSLFERGLQRPSDEQWKKIADVLQVDVEELKFYTYDEQHS